MADSYLQQLVITRCKELGDDKAAEFFAVSVGLVKQWVAGSKTPSLAAVEKVFALPDAPPKDAGWEGREVFIALPFYKSTHPLTLFALLGVWDRAKFRAGMKFNDAFVAHARNQLAEDFLSTGVPWSWWIDDDIVFPMGHAGWFNQFTGMSAPDQFAGLHTPTRLRSHGKSFVSGVYVDRVPKGRGAFAEARERNPEGDAANDRAHDAPFDALVPTKFTGLGCAMIAREVFTDIQAKFPHLAPSRPGEPFQYFTNASDPLIAAVPELKQKIEAASQQTVGGTAEEARRILTDLVKQIDSATERTRADTNPHQGEDKTFCRRAIDAGHQPHIDFAVVCGHVGPHVFTPQNTRSG